MNYRTRQIILSVIFLIMAFQSYGFSNEVIGVKVKGHTTEFSIEDDEVAGRQGRH